MAVCVQHGGGGGGGGGGGKCGGMRRDVTSQNRCTLTSTDHHRNHDQLSDHPQHQHEPEKPDKPEVTLRILNKGPDYFRKTVLNRRSSAETAERRKSAVELLQETKSHFYPQSSGSENTFNLLASKDGQAVCRMQHFFEEHSRSRAEAVEEWGQADSENKTKQSAVTKNCNQGRAHVKRHNSHGSDGSVSRSHVKCDKNDSLSNRQKLNMDKVDENIHSSNHDNSESHPADIRPIRNTSHVATCMASLSVNQSDAQKVVSSGDNNSSSVRRNGIDMLSLHANDLNWDVDRCSDSAIGTDKTYGTTDSSVVVRRRSKRSSVHRSRSDLSHRYSNSSDLSELSAHLSRHSQDFDRLSRNSQDLERFFNEMGLEKDVLDPINMSHLQSLGVFDSVSSLDTADTISIYERRSDGADKLDELDPKIGQTSIVERNARIIKWLCNVKRAKSTD